MRGVHLRQIGLAFVVAALAAPWAVRGGGARAEDAAAAVVQDYYRNVAIYDYRAAYDLLGSGLRQSRPYDQFVRGYADTAYVEVETSGAQPIANGRERVTVVITAWHNDATIHRYLGTYDVGPENGADRILDARITEGEPPSFVAPLCRAADLGFALTDWVPATVNRYCTLTATNQGATTCLTAGVPRVTVLDQQGGRLISSVPEAPDPVTAVSLRPGEQSQVLVRWVNWCGAQPTLPMTLSIDVPGDTQATRLPFTLGDEAIAPPPCLGVGQPSQLTARPFAAEAA
jgi:hypothetical protein